MALEITAQQLPPQHPHRLATTCDLHPEETFTGFCASCLRERLAGLDTSSAASATGRKSTSAIKSLFSKVSGAAAGGGGAAFELRRSKSFSCGRGDSLPRASTSFEPQRRSCDVRGRNTLWSLFHQNDKEPAFVPSSSSAAVAASSAVTALEVECPNLGFPPPCVPETREDEEEEQDDDDDDEIRVVDPVLVIGTSGEIEGEIKETNEVKPMKLHIDQESQPKKPPPKDFKEIAGSFWLAASAFSTKWQKWRRKHKLKKQVSKAAAAAMPQEKQAKSSRRRFRDTQSEVAVDAFGRRSCDTDPRFSLDAGRMSFDDPRYSWDEPRASWDGYLMGGGGRPVFSRLNPMLSVVEDAPAPAIQRSDGQIPVEEDVAIPGGTTQTRDYYLDSSSRRRRSFERSSSVRRTSVDLSEAKPPPPAAIANANAKVTPAGGTEFYHFHHAGSFLDRDFSSTSLRDDISESFESAFQDSRKGGPAKKSKRWSKAWNIWGLIYRRGTNREGANVVERSFSESWPELRSRSYNANILRSNSSVSARSSFSGSNGFGSMRRSSIEINGHGKKKKEEFVLERNRSARYSPGRIDNGMLRFYLTPMGNSRRNGVSGKGKPPVSSHSMPRSMLRLY